MAKNPGKVEVYPPADPTNHRTIAIGEGENQRFFAGTGADYSAQTVTCAEWGETDFKIADPTVKTYWTIAYVYFIEPIRRTGMVCFG